MKIPKMLVSCFFIMASLSFAFGDDHREKDIVDTAVSAGNFKTLAAALSAADLVDTLKSDGPFTVFAPTDEAFAQLPDGTVEMLLKPENKDQLIDVLTYHVIAGKVPAKTAVTLSETTALNGKTIALNVRDGDLFLNNAKVVKTDLETSNGIIHVIDSVLLPPSMVSPSETRSRMGKSAQKIVGMAIDKGVPLFNHGNHAACAAVYEMTAEMLLMMPEDEVGPAQRQMLKMALNQAAMNPNATDNAWTMRRALDSSMEMQLTMDR